MKDTDGLALLRSHLRVVLHLYPQNIYHLVLVIHLQPEHLTVNVQCLVLSLSLFQSVKMLGKSLKYDKSHTHVSILKVNHV